MTSNWGQFKISDFLLRKKDQIFIDDKKTYKRLTIRMHNKGICVRDEILGSRIGTKNQFTVKSGWLLLSKIDARNGAFGIIPSEADGGIITGNFWAYELDLSKIDPQFFFYFSHSQKFLDFCIASSQGATNRRYLQEELFLNREILLPPLPEQKRIVKKIKEVEEKANDIIRETNKKETYFKKILDSFLASVYDFKHEAWNNIPFETAIQVDRGYAFKSGDYQKKGIFLLRVSDINSDGSIDRSSAKYLPESFLEEYTNYQLFDDDLLLVMVGGTTGKVGFVKEKDLPALLNQNIWRLKVKSNFSKIINSTFFKYWVINNQKKVQEHQTDGTGYQYLRQADYNKLILQYPNFKDQEKIVRKIESLNNFANLAKNEIKKQNNLLLSLKSSVLAKAFNGEL